MNSDDFHKYTEDELITKYYTLRDQYRIVDGRKFYFNIQHLFATPFEREKDKIEQKKNIENLDINRQFISWYERAKNESCVWWIENHIIARHSLHSCMSCGACTGLCPAAELYDFTPRMIMDIVSSKDEDQIIDLLCSDTIWMCHQCGSCKTKCPRNSSLFGLISSLRQLSQIKGYHVNSIRGRQQYAGRHLWGGNLWNRACTLYFRNPVPAKHKDLGPGYEKIYNNIEEYFINIGACPDMEGVLSGRKISTETLDELRKLWIEAGVLHFWDIIECAAQKQADEWGMTIEEYLVKIGSEG